MNIIQSTTLHFKEGSSDKLYSVSIDERNGGYIVIFTYGRAGSAQKAGTKTQNPVSLEQARVIYDKLVREKTSKGYLPVGEAPRYSLTGEEGEDTGFRCQLLNPVAEELISDLIGNWDWCMQRKWDGERRGLQVTDSGIIFTNRKGQVIAGSEPLVQDASGLPKGTQLDGEAMGDHIRVFDILRVDGEDLRHRTYSERLQELRVWMTSWHSMKGVDTAITSDEKRRMWKQAREENWEGVVFKCLDAPYTAGRPASGGTALKFKFVESCSCIVHGINDKRSVTLNMVGPSGRVAVGSVTIPPNHEIPPVGTVIEVQYLYAYQGGSLFQPVYKGPRHDLQSEDCLASRLKYKAD